MKTCLKNDSNVKITFSEDLIQKNHVTKIQALLLIIGVLKSFGYYLLTSIMNQINNVFHTESGSVSVLM
jgi:hypothetical protein